MNLSEGCFLVSGGGRGITAACVVALARRTGGSFVLLGRTVPGTLSRRYLSADEAGLRAEAAAAIEAEGRKPTPVAVRRIVNAVLAEREIEATLRAVSEAGGRAEYLEADVTDAGAVRAAVLRSTLGPVRGIIHGAGVIADNPIEKKTAADLERILSTKVNGLHNLLEAIDAGRLESLILFSSVAGFAGNAGQADYAAANEILNKFALSFARNRPNCRVVSLCWGPWDGGMVTPELKALFMKAKVEVIPTGLGTAIFTDLLEREDREVEVVIGSASLPFLERSQPARGPLRIERELVLSENPFLLDHVIDGKPVLPATCASGWLEDVSRSTYHGFSVHRIEDFRVLKGIVFDDEVSRSYLMEVIELDRTPDSVSVRSVITSRTAAGKPRYHYRADIGLVREIPPRPTYERFEPRADEGLAEWNPYEDGTLFHGPSFRIITKIIGIDDRKLTALCRYRKVPDDTKGRFLIDRYDPFCRDVQFQCLGVWAARSYGSMGLPLGCRRSEFYLDVPHDVDFYVSVEIDERKERTVSATITVHDKNALVYARSVCAELTMLPNRRATARSAKGRRTYV